jgi:hypothetical protein
MVDTVRHDSTTIGDVSGFAALVAAEAGWRALFATVDGGETGRSRIIAWASVERDGTSEIVGIIADPNDPKRLVAADTVTDEDGGMLFRYGFID